MLEVIKNRRSCRQFKSTKIDEKTIKEIIDAGLNAPSGMNRQTPIVIAIQDTEIRNKLAELNRSFASSRWPEGFDPFYGAPLILLVIAHKDGLSVHDGSACIENMLLEATNQGLGSCWIHRAKEEIESKEGRELLKSTGLNFDDYIGVGHVIVGYKEDHAEIRPKEIKEGRYYII